MPLVWRVSPPVRLPIDGGGGGGSKYTDNILQYIDSSYKDKGVSQTNLYVENGCISRDVEYEMQYDVPVSCIN